MTSLILSLALALAGQCSTNPPAPPVLPVAPPSPQWSVSHSYYYPVPLVRRSFRPVRGVIRLLGGVCR